jgi:hypothetical protein
MVEFTETLRRMCRKCRGKLPTPTSNDREGFCCRGCYEQWYRKRCRVCEAPIEQKPGQQRIVCKKSSCKSAWHQRAGFGRFLRPVKQNPPHISSAASTASEVPVPQGFPKPSKAVGLQAVAGPALSPDAYHAAAIPDGPSLKWEGGSFQRTEAGNRTAMHRHLAAQHRQLVRHAFAVEHGARWPIAETAPSIVPGDPELEECHVA